MIAINDDDAPLVLAFEDNEAVVYWDEFTGDSTIASFCQKLVNHHNYNNGRSYEWKIDYNGTFLETANNKKFKDYGITCDYQFLTVELDTIGGTQIEGRRQIPKHDKLKIIKGKCCIKLETRDCVKMSCCGCLISADGMYDHLDSTKTLTHYKLLKCPIYECRKPWIVKTCLFIAGVKGQEKKEWINLFEKRAQKKDRNIKKCPHCGVFGRQNRTKRWMRITCGGCRKEFCFSCGQNWIKTSSKQICGNRNCIAEIKQRRLRLKKYLSTSDGRSWVKRNDVPNARVCPKCMQLITHSKKCQHMKCQRCAYDFCWLCCQDWTTHSNNSTKYHQDCTFIPVQDIYNM
jgi:hypothetical protein